MKYLSNRILDVFEDDDGWSILYPDGAVSLFFYKTEKDAMLAAQKIPIRTHYTLSHNQNLQSLKNFSHEIT